MNAKSLGTGALLCTALVMGAGCDGGKPTDTRQLGATDGVVSMRFVTQTAAYQRARTPTVIAIQGRVKRLQDRGLDASERASAKALKAKVKQVGALHHVAMQEAIKDPTLRRIAKSEDRCDARVRYGMKYSPIAEGQSGHTYRSSAERATALRTMASHFETCAGLAQSSIFAPAPRVSAPLPAGADIIRADTMSTAFIDYVFAMAGALESATSLEHARTIIDSYLVGASYDPFLMGGTLDAIAAAASLAESSAEEWDTYYQSNEMSVFFIWNWMSSLGNFIRGRVANDVGGCGVGMAVAFAIMTDSNWSGTIGDFFEIERDGCVIGGIIGSALVW